MKKLSIIIPAYNEEKTIEKVISEVKKSKLPIKKEIIVVDDCSDDGTFEKIKKIKGIKILRHKKNKGKGGAIRTAIRHVTGDIIIIQDADSEVNPGEYPKLIKPILDGKTNVVYGSRFKEKTKNKKDTFYYGNLFLTFITNILYCSRITDMETCYKVMKSGIMKNLNLKANTFDIEPEITAKILKKGYKICEVPIEYRPRSSEEGKKMRWKDGIKAIKTLIKYRFKN